MNISFPLSEWLDRYMYEDSITAVALEFEVALTGPWLAGGAVRRCMFDDLQNSDYDFFFANEDQLTKFKAKCDSLGLKKTKTTKNATQYEGAIGGVDYIIQAVHLSFPSGVVELIDRFDFTASMFAYDSILIHTTNYAIRDAATKSLVINRVIYPEATLRRILKYAKNGFKMCAGAMRVFLVESAKVIAENPPVVEYID